MAEARVRKLLRPGERVSALDLNADEWAAYLRLRNIEPMSNVPATEPVWLKSR